MIGLCFYLMPTSIHAQPARLDVLGPDSCGFARLQTLWVGGIAQLWPLTGTPNPNFITNVRFEGNNYILLVDEDDNVIYSDVIDFDVSNIPIINCSQEVKCARLLFNEMMSLSELKVAHYVTEGIYSLYMWTDYRIYYDYYGAPQTDTDTWGSSTVPISSMEVYSLHIAHPYNVDNVIINDQIKEVGTVYACLEDNNVVFDMKTSWYFEDYAELRTSWAEVTSCNDSIPDFSLENLSNPRVLQLPTNPIGGMRYTDSLFVGNLTDTSFLDNNPFLDNNNIGKRYILRFELTNTRMCEGDTMVLEHCVVFTGEPYEFQMNLKTTSASPFNGAIVSTYQDTDLEDAPLLGYGGEEQVKFQFSQGIVDNAFIDVYLVDEDGDVLETLVEDYEKEFPSGINQYNVDYSISLHEIEIPSNSNIGWVYGSNPFPFENNYFYYGVQNGYLYYKIVLKLANECGEEEEWSYFRINPSNFYKMADIGGNNSAPVEIYPNPFTDFIQIEGLEEGSSYEILNMQGIPLKVGNMASNILNLNFLPAGQYFFKFTDEKGEVEMKKAVKIR